jgi:hypothetical protein
MACTQVAEEQPPIGREAAYILNKQLQTADKGWYSLGVGLTTPHWKNVSCYKT